MKKLNATNKRTLATTQGQQQGYILEGQDIYQNSYTIQVYQIDKKWYFETYNQAGDMVDQSSVNFFTRAYALDCARKYLMRKHEP